MVDGSESDIREDLVVPIDGIGTGRRVPWGAIAIGILTAVVAMGALGQDPAAPAVASGISRAGTCPAPSAPDLVDVGAASPAATLFPWWERPSPVLLWVDPATGLLRTRERALPERSHLVSRGR